MCGRYSWTKTGGRVRVGSGGQFQPRYNIAPIQRAMVFAAENGAVAEKVYRWGLVPFWAKDETIGADLINARSETVAAKPAFRNSFQKRRCLVPADGFYEWRKQGRSKWPVRIVLKSREPFVFAGIWDAWTRPDGEELPTFSILTTAANDLLQAVHHRMPVILRESEWDAWLDPGASPASLQALLKAFPSSEMEYYPVSTRVNAAGHDQPDCIEAATPPPPEPTTGLLNLIFDDGSQPRS